MNLKEASRSGGSRAWPGQTLSTAPPTLPGSPTQGSTEIHSPGRATPLRAYTFALQRQTISTRAPNPPCASAPRGCRGPRATEEKEDLSVTQCGTGRNPSTTGCIELPGRRVFCRWKVQGVRGRRPRRRGASGRTRAPSGAGTRDRTAAISGSNSRLRRCRAGRSRERAPWRWRL